MRRIEPCPLPDGAFLRHYQRYGSYTDCYRVRVRGKVDQHDFVSAFYTTWLFKLERLILSWCVNRPSTDEDARQMSLGHRDHFAAWRVEERSATELLLCDFTGRTRSWLMAESGDGADGKAASSVLYFGSAVVPRVNPTTGETSLGPTYRMLLGFHKLYSRLLLGATCARLERR